MALPKKIFQSTPHVVKKVQRHYDVSQGLPLYMEKKKEENGKEKERVFPLDVGTCIIAFS